MRAVTPPSGYQGTECIFPFSAPDAGTIPDGIPRRMERVKEAEPRNMVLGKAQSLSLFTVVL
jgi:hypothetical protein